MGAGAVGCYFGGMLARAGAGVTLIGRKALADAIARDGLFIDSVHFQERVRVFAATDPAAVRDADIILFCVKTTSNEEAAATIRPHLKPGAIVVSLQNGVDNVERLQAAGVSALASVVYVAVEMTAPGRIKHAGRGDLVVGNPQRQADVERFAATFRRAGVNCKISDNMQTDLWSKLVWNCAGNAISALGRASYGRLSANELSSRVLIEAAMEVIAVGKAAGVQFPPTDLAATRLKLARDLGNATSSTSQDVERGKKTEIDSLNGYVVRRGEELGIPTPVNRTLYALVKLLDERLDQQHEVAGRS